jgi:hypothetical protein
VAGGALAVVVAAGGDVVEGDDVVGVVEVIAGDVVLDDRDDARVASDAAPALHAVPTRARLASRTQSLSTRRCYVAPVDASRERGSAPAGQA